MLHIALVLLVIGLLLWVANTYIPLAEPIKKILNIVVIVLTIFWLLSVFGILNGVLPVNLK